MNIIKYHKHTKRNVFPMRIFKIMKFQSFYKRNDYNYGFYPKFHDFRQIHDKVLKDYIIVVIDQDDNIVVDTFNNLDIVVLDKTYVEKYLIYSVKMDPYSVKSLKENSWCVNISKGV